MKDFDFDEWAALYRRDPRAFEARRQTMLAIEIARGGDHAASASAALRRMEEHLAGQDEQERARRSFIWMIASIQQLNERMAALSTSVSALNQTLSDSVGSEQ